MIKIFHFNLGIKLIALAILNKNFNKKSLSFILQKTITRSDSYLFKQKTIKRRSKMFLFISTNIAAKNFAFLLILLV